MSELIVPGNARQPWSQITNTEILQPKDELRIVGVGFVAIVGVLDSHDLKATTYGQTVAAFGMGERVLGNHHHVLLQFEGSDEVLSTGLHVGQGDVQSLLFPHARVDLDGEEYRQRLRTAVRNTREGALGLYYISGNEQLSATPQGQAFLAPDGRLKTI
jgi:hypothetical protein